MGKERIELDNLVNTRDLGGYVNKDGKRIKNKRLLRSAALNAASPNDKKTLCDEYNLKYVCDFRNTNEIRMFPDPEMDGVSNVWIPIFPEEVESITRGPSWDVDDPLGIYLFFKKMFENRQEGEEEGGFYRQFVLSDDAINGYKRFFEILLNNEEGSTLWHCSAGKDRCGMGTVYLLKALGFDDELIKADYLFSNDCYQGLIEKHIAIAKERGYDEALFKVIEEVNGVKLAYLEKVYSMCDELYGGLDNFMREKLELDDTKINRLKDLYLE